MKYKMKVLVINSGSSSIKFQLLDMNNEQVLLKGGIDNVNLPSCKIIINGKEKSMLVKDHEEGIKYILSIIPKQDIDIIVHRVVHGGEHYSHATLIDEKVKQIINELSSIAPLHNPPNLAGILACEKLLPQIPQVAVFDTSFHQTIKKEAYLYGIPYEYYEKYKIRKYGFHGSSHRYIMLETKRILKKSKISMISCHLGNGSSITAIQDDESIDTTMGFTPAPGLIMGSRAGDIDPSIITFLQKKENLTPDQIDSLLNKKSGFLGLCGISDMRLIHEKAEQGHLRCQLVLDILAYDIAKYISSYLSILKDVDAITFTGGIGENAYYLREKVFEYIHGTPLLNKTRNKNNEQIISGDNAITKILVIKTNEELMIARDSIAVLKRIQLI